VSEPAIKLTSYFAERDRVGARFFADALSDVYERHEIRASVLLRGVAGFGDRHGVHSELSLTLSESLPAVSVAVDVAERIEAALPEVYELAEHGLVSLERARLLTGSGAAVTGSTIKLTLYGGGGVRTDGEAGYVAAIEVLRKCGVGTRLPWRRRCRACPVSWRIRWPPSSASSSAGHMAPRSRLRRRRTSTTTRGSRSGRS
jgi:PII-like signaling protein